MAFREGRVRGKCRPVYSGDRLKINQMKVHEFKRAHSRVTLGPAYLPGDEATLVLHVSRVWFDSGADGRVDLQPGAGVLPIDTPPTARGRRIPGRDSYTSWWACQHYGWRIPRRIKDRFSVSLLT